MCKKVWIAAVAVVAGVALLGLTGTKVGSLIRLKWRNVCQQAQNQVTPETEVQRIRMELDRLARDDRHYEDQIARQMVDVDKLQARVNERRTALTKLDGELRAMTASLKGEGELVSYGSDRYSRADMQKQVRLDARRFQRLEAALKGEEELLRIKKDNLDQNKQKLEEIKLAREKMRTTLQEIENALVQERRAQNNGATLDDGNLGRLNQDIQSLQDRIKVMQKKRELRGETSTQGPVRAVQAQKQADAELDNLINTRWGSDTKQAPVVQK